MAIKDSNLNWTSEALQVSQNLQDALRPLMEQTLAYGMTKEDFYYLAGNAAQMLILISDRHEKDTHQGK